MFYQMGKDTRDLANLFLLSMALCFLLAFFPPYFFPGPIIISLFSLVSWPLRALHPCLKPGCSTVHNSSSSICWGGNGAWPLRLPLPGTAQKITQPASTKPSSAVTRETELQRKMHLFLIKPVKCFELSPHMHFIALAHGKLSVCTSVG